MRTLKFLATTAVVLVASFLIGCGADDRPMRIGFVADTGSIDDRSFNASIWKGIQDARTELGVEASYRASSSPSDYAPNIQAFIDGGESVIVTAGVLMADATRAAAIAHPDRRFAIVDAAYEPVLPNVVGLTFRTDEAAMLAGYLAAAMSRSGLIGTFGGLRISGVTMYMVGLEAGVARYAAQKGRNVRLAGWKTDFTAPGCGSGLFAGGFSDPEAGRRLSSGLIDEGADVVVPIAGSTGLGAAAVAKERGAWIIGADSDQYVAAPEHRTVYLTSILKNSDRAVHEVIRAAVAGRFAGGEQTGTLGNGGVGLAPFHDFDATVPAELKAELDRLRQDIIDGKVSSGWERCATR